MAGAVIQGYFPRAVAQTKALPAHVAARLGMHGGQPLPADVRQKMEAAFGQRFHDVRVVVGHAAEAIGAIAFTRGSQIHFAQGQYNPSTVAGQKVLAHELAHVVQQRTGRVRNPFGNDTAIVHDATLEAEAERMAARATLQFAAAPHAPVQRKVAAVQAMRAPSPRVVQLKAALRRHVPSRAVIQRMRVSATILNAVGVHTEAVKALAKAFGVSEENILSALLDPALDLAGAVDMEMHTHYLANPLDYASCHPTAKALNELIGEGEAFTRSHDTFDTGQAVRAEVEQLIARMQQNEDQSQNAVYRIDFAGHGFSLIGTKDADDNGLYKYDLIDTVASVSPILPSLQARRVHTPAAAKTHLRAMASDDINTRRSGALDMGGWDADGIYLGAEKDGKVHFPGIQLKWSVRRLRAQYEAPWIEQFKSRYNALAKLKQLAELQ
jgi:hypothetical protein